MAEAEDQGNSISADFVKLVSNDEHEFILKRSHALTSGTIKAMLSYPTSFKNKEMSKVQPLLVVSHFFISVSALNLDLYKFIISITLLRNIF